MQALTVHHLEFSRSERLLWLFEELELDYAIEKYPRTKTGRAPEALRKIHPLGKSPLLVHGDTVLAESAATIEYVLDEFGEGRLRPPPATEAFQRYRFFLHFAEGSMMAPLLVKLLFGRIRKAVPIVGGLIANKVDQTFTNAEIASHLTFVEATLRGSEWLAGEEISAADIMMRYPLHAAIHRGGLTERFPKTEKFLTRIASRDAYIRAERRGGQFDVPE